MNRQRGANSLSSRIPLRATAFVAVAAVTFFQWPASRAEATSTAVDFHVIAAGGASLHNSCFQLSGSVGQVAPGYSSNASDSIVAGFWSAAPATGLDEIHFNGFEGC